MESKEPLGLSPAVLAKREFVKPSPWCQKLDIEFDSWCDPDNPKTILHKDVIKAAGVIREKIPITPLTIDIGNKPNMYQFHKPCSKDGFVNANAPSHITPVDWKSRFTKNLNMDLYYKFELFHRTGSFSERGALYALKMLNDEQRRVGVITSSLGNWAMALAYWCQILNIPVTVVLPENTLVAVVEKCLDFGATVILNGNSLAESKRHAFTLLTEDGKTYINGYDHPHVIAGAGTIGMEILEQLPQTDAILVPVGGGALIAGIAAVVKHFRPEVLIYGVEPDKACSFFKAMQNEWPYQTAVARSVAETLAVPTAGYNAFHTAQSLIDKMVLVNDDWITRAILHLLENEKLVVEGAGAVSFSALLAVPDILPELQKKNVVCVITGGTMDVITLPKCLERAKAVEGRLIKLTVTLPADEMKQHIKVLSMIANVGCNIIQCYIDRGWTTDNEFFTIYLTLIIETKNLEHACTLKRVMERLFPNKCDFLEEPFSPIPICACFPKKMALTL